MKDSTRDALERYVQVGMPTGDFLRAVLSNDLKESFARADRENTRDMHEIVSYCYNDVPVLAWGSEKKVDAWIEMGGLKGFIEKQEGAARQCVEPHG